MPQGFYSKAIPFAEEKHTFFEKEPLIYYWVLVKMKHLTTGPMKLELSVMI